MEQFEVQFAEQYKTIHRLETNKLRNVAKVRFPLYLKSNCALLKLIVIKVNEIKLYYIVDLISYLLNHAHCTLTIFSTSIITHIVEYTARFIDSFSPT